MPSGSLNDPNIDPIRRPSNASYFYCPCLSSGIASSYIRTSVEESRLACWGNQISFQAEQQKSLMALLLGRLDGAAPPGRPTSQSFQDNSSSPLLFVTTMCSSSLPAMFKIPADLPLPKANDDLTASPRTDKVAVRTRSMPKDGFLFYSIDENRRDAMCNRPVDNSNDESGTNAPMRRKTRLSFESDLLRPVTRSYSSCNSACNFAL